MKTEIEIYSASKNYATADRARKVVSRLQEKFNMPIRHFIYHNPETNRFHPVLIGADNISFAHDGFQVIAS